MASLLAALVSQWWISRHSKEERHAPTNILCEHKFACKRYSFSFYSFIYYLSTIAMQFSGHMWPSLEGWLQVIRALHVGFYPAYRIWLLPLSRLPEGKTRQEPQTGWSTLTGLRIPSFDTGVGEGGVMRMGYVPILCTLGKNSSTERHPSRHRFLPESQVG